MGVSDKRSSMLRFGFVFITAGVMTLSYFAFSHYVHGWMKNHHFEPPSFNPDGGDHRGGEHGRGGPFEGIYLKKDGLLLYGLALPLAVLALVSSMWNPRSTKREKDVAVSTWKIGLLPSLCSSCYGGDIKVQEWTIILFLLPLLLIMFDGSREHIIGSASRERSEMHWSSWNIFLTSLMSPTGYAAVWALAAFLIPVTKHSPILDWLRVTPVQALAFHRVAGWVSLVNSVLHGFLHLRHLMDVLNIRRENPRPWYEELWILLVPPSWECVADQNPFAFLEETRSEEHESSRCWLSLVNATGMISTLAFVLLGVTSLPRVRRASYGLFYTVHIPAAWIMLIMAIWHYPTCALVLIPNILYYLSFNVPVLVTYVMNLCGSWRWRAGKTSSIMEARLLQGGAVELVFATSADTDDDRRHESRFVKISHPLVSVVSHPFSVFSPQDLVVNKNPLPQPVLAILFRPTGPFTKSLAKLLFPDHHAEYESNDTHEAARYHLLSDEEERSGRDGVSTENDPPDSASPEGHSLIQFDAFYAGSFDWIERAMSSHDEILLIAGGVGITPFLEFLPALQKRIQTETALISDTAETFDGSHHYTAIDNAALVVGSSNVVGPKQIYLHWYCRDIGLASYVWQKYLRSHAQNDWEGAESCQNRLKIQIHVTSLADDTTTPSFGEIDEDVAGVDEHLLTSSRNSGVVETHTYFSQDALQGGLVRPVKDARVAQSWWLGLLLSGIVMVGGTVIHWWWYKYVIIDDKFRMYNFIMRAHALVFTILLAVTVTIVVEACCRCFGNDRKDPLQRREQDQTLTASSTTTNPQDETTQGTYSLRVNKSRPLAANVVEQVLKARAPGVYMCGPHDLMQSMESTIRRDRADCSFYREDSEI